MREGKEREKFMNYVNEEDFTKFSKFTLCY